ncbi:MAG: hypothetical protein R3E90_14980 [Marinicella sp.]|nr:hypothetical protein [Xanthomonadales bacterium]
MDHKQLNLLIKRTMNESTAIKVISLSTADGFNVCTEFGDDYRVEKEKLSAVSSSLASLSNAACKQILKTRLKATIIESIDGNLIFIKTKYGKSDSVLCLIASSELLVGKARYYARQLALSIHEIAVDI